MFPCIKKHKASKASQERLISFFVRTSNQYQQEYFYLKQIITRVFSEVSFEALSMKVTIF
jgi:hypothetical protein